MKAINRIICTMLFATICSIGIHAQENQSYFLHTIEKGQSLYSISSMYGVSQEDIVRLNPGSEEKIYVGRQLRIPRTATAGTTQETFHTISAGETLYRLTVKYKVFAQDICKANPGLSAENFRIGEVIRIPAATNEQTTPSAESGTPSGGTVGQGPVEPRCKEMHRVKKKETIYSISREYGITENELIGANPELKTEKLKKGALLCIPNHAESRMQVQQQTTTPSDTELFEENRRRYKRISTIQAAIILPFLPESGTQNEISRTVEYYEGFLLAVDSLKRRGTSIDLYTYDSGKDVNSLNAILAKSELKNMDIIIGPLHQQQIKPLADFANKNNIRLIVPFTSRDNTVFNNASIYQINTPQSYLFSEVYDHFVRQFPNANVIFLESSSTSQDEAEFIKGLKDELANRAIPMTTLKENATMAQMQTTLRNDRENIFIPTTANSMILVKCLPELQMLVRSNENSRIHLFGYPKWQTYTNDHLDAFFEVDTYFYSSFYTNDLLPAAKKFILNYRRWYGKEMMDDRYPKFGMLGFDTGYFFLKGLSRYGSDLEEHLQDVEVVPVQTGFKFQRVNNFGGFINQKVFFVHFSKNYELQKLDYDK